MTKEANIRMMFLLRETGSPPPGLAVQGLEFFVRQRDRRRRHIFFQMFDFRGARNRQHHRTALEKPGQGDGAGATLWLAAILSSTLPGAARAPADKGNQGMNPISCFSQ